MTTEQASVTLPGTVEITTDSPIPGEPGKAQISIEGADSGYRDIGIENTLADKEGGEVVLKPGAAVRVTIRAGQSATVTKS